MCVPYVFQDVETEHAYIMAKALHSYHEYQAQEEREEEERSPRPEPTPRLLLKRPRAQIDVSLPPQGPQSLSQAPRRPTHRAHSAQIIRGNTRARLAPAKPDLKKGQGCSVDVIAEVGRANSTCSTSSGDR